VPLSDDIDAALASADQGKQCKLFALPLNEKDLEAVLVYVDKIRDDQSRPQSERFFTVAGLKKLLNDNRYKIGKTVISEHVRKVCICER
jgi:hypothetical protein